MNKTVINALTLELTEMYCQRPFTPLLIATNGQETSTSKLISLLDEKLTGNQPGALTTIESKNRSLGIANIKQVMQRLQLKGYRGDTDTAISRIVHIPRAETLTPEAQNALLKLFEELPQYTVIVISATSTEPLLKTVLSRCSSVEILPINHGDARELAAEHSLPSSEADKLYFASEGYADTFLELIADEDHQILQQIQQAKEYIKQPVPDRLKTNEALARSRPDLAIFLHALQITVATAMRHAKTTANTTRWQSVLTQVLQSKKDLQTNGNSKLILLHLATHI